MSSASTNTAVSEAESAESAAAEKRSYGQILKSSAMIGGSQALAVAIGVVRTKVIALLLGPSGFGLAGLYGSIIDVAVNAAGLGVTSSGVRQIAEAVGSGDTGRIARTAAVLRRTSMLLGMLGAVLLAVFSMQVSTLTFGDAQRAAGVSLLSLAVLFRLVSAGQGALIQGMRRISDLALIGVMGALFGTISTIALVYWLEEDGIVPSLVAVAATTIITSWWYSRKIQLPQPSFTASEIKCETAALLKLGFVFMCSNLMGVGSAYVVRIIVLRQLGLQATGLYQTAWTLGGLYVGFILQAMGADFYPRLVAHASNSITCNRLVNEQTRIGLLLAGPGVVATIAFAPMVLVLFYGSAFGEAIGVLRWICLGVMLRLISWPMSFVFLARGKKGLAVGSDLAWTIVHLGLAWISVGLFGLQGAGAAFFGSYAFHVILVYVLLRRLCGFRWSRENQTTAIILLSLTSVVFLLTQTVQLGWALYVVGSLAVGVTTVYSVRALVPLACSEPSATACPELTRRVQLWLRRLANVV